MLTLCEGIQQLRWALASTQWYIKRFLYVMTSSYMSLWQSYDKATLLNAGDAIPHILRYSNDYHENLMLDFDANHEKKTFYRLIWHRNPSIFSTSYAWIPRPSYMSRQQVDISTSLFKLCYLVQYPGSHLDMCDHIIKCIPYTFVK